VIGSIHCKKVDYPRSINFFSINNALPNRIEAKREIKNTIDKDILGKKNIDWKPSVSVEKSDYKNINLFKVN